VTKTRGVEEKLSLLGEGGKRIETLKGGGGGRREKGLSRDLVIAHRGQGLERSEIGAHSSYDRRDSKGRSLQWSSNGSSGKKNMQYGGNAKKKSERICWIDEGGKHRRGGRRD